MSMDSWFPNPHDKDIAQLEEGLAYRAIKSGNNWILPSGKNAANGDPVVLDGVFGYATAAIVGGTDAIVEDTNWKPYGDGGALSALNSNYLTITPGTDVTITSSPLVKYPKQIVGIVDINKSSGTWTTGWHNNIAQLTSDFPEKDLTFPAFTGSGAGAFVRIMTTGEIRVNPTASTNRVVGIIVY